MVRYVFRKSSHAIVRRCSHSYALVREVIEVATQIPRRRLSAFAACRLQPEKLTVSLAVYLHLCHQQDGG